MINALIIGGGPIGLVYSRICHSLGFDHTLLTRSHINNSPARDTQIINGDIFFIEKEKLKKFSHIIVAVQPRYTFKILSYLLDNTSAFLLVEKPLCLYGYEFEKISKKVFDSRIYVAFNRRFFESTLFGLPT